MYAIRSYYGVSAIVDIVGKSGNHTKPAVYGGVNLISANLTAEIPITKKLTVVAAGRRAYSDMYSTWLADELLNDKLGQTRLPAPDANVITPEFYFSDFNLKVSYEINEQENLSASAYGSKDYLNSSNDFSNDRGDISVEDINEWGNYGFGATWNKQWNKTYFSSLQLGHRITSYNVCYTKLLRLLLAQPQHRHKRLLRNLNAADHFHALLAFFLLLQQLTLTGDIAAVTFG